MASPSIDHPLSTSSGPSTTPSTPGRLPSPPLSPSDLTRDIEHFAGAPSSSRVPETGIDLAASQSRDPLLLKSRLQSQEHITSLRHRGGEGSAWVKRQRGAKMSDFYTRQNGQIESLLKTIDDHVAEGQEDEDNNRTAIKIAIYASFACNSVLAVLQIFAAVSSLSLSFFATAVDSIFDPMANGVLLYCHKKAQRVDLHKYPSGGSRFETIGDIVYSGVMGAVSLILVAFAIQDLVRGASDKQLHIPALIAVAIAFLTKLSLFAYCFAIRGKNSQVRVLWEDHRNDLFINGFGLFTNAAGAKIAWWIDPMGALIISVVLIVVWGNTVKNHLGLLAGKAAPIEFQQLIVYKAMTFADDIKQIDSAVAYHSGPNYIVEVDIVMDGSTPLSRAHDVSQALQDKLEELPQVDRCFCHVDWNSDHKPEHRKYK